MLLSLRVVSPEHILSQRQGVDPMTSEAALETWIKRTGSWLGCSSSRSSSGRRPRAQSRGSRGRSALSFLGAECRSVLPVRWAGAARPQRQKKYGARGPGTGRLPQKFVFINFSVCLVFLALCLHNMHPTKCLHLVLAVRSFCAAQFKKRVKTAFG